MYFIYPAFLLIGLIGLNDLFRLILLIKERLKKKIVITLIYLVIIISLSTTMHFLISMHPFQYIYFNQIAGNDPLRKFDGDYYGLSYYPALKSLLKTYPNDTLKIYVTNSTGILNQINFKSQDISRIKYVDKMEDAYFLITTYYYPGDSEKYKAFWLLEFPFNQKLIYKMKFQKSLIIGIYKFGEENLLLLIDNP
jgi:hypothetical protein